MVREVTDVDVVTSREFFRVQVVVDVTKSMRKFLFVDIMGDE